MKPFELGMILGFALGIAGMGGYGCGSQKKPAANPAAAECVAHRTAKQLECVDLFNTKLEINACRDKVKAEIDCTKDGGADGS